MIRVACVFLTPSILHLNSMRNDNAQKSKISKREKKIGLFLLPGSLVGHWSSHSILVILGTSTNLSKYGHGNYFGEKRK